MVKVLTVGLLSLLLASACGRQSHEIQAQNSEPSAYVSAEQAKAAFGLVYKIDYLPFAYVEDGCYARSLYMSMELAVDEIPSSAHYIWGELHPNANTQWRYHVAPLIKIDSQEAWILDPALESEPLRLSKWIGKNFPRGSYQTEVKAGSAYFDDSGRTDEFDANNMIRNFSEMPTFLTGDIASSCAVMYSYLAREGLDTKNKRAKLLSRTTELVSGLDSVGKLEVATGDTGSALGSNSLCDRAIRAGQN